MRACGPVGHVDDGPARCPAGIDRVGPARARRRGGGRGRLARIGRDAVRSGLVVASGGNLSARAPGADDIWVTAAGSWLDRLDDGEFVRVRLSDGAGVAVRRRAPPSTEVALHLATYRVRPDVNAIVHLHPQTSDPAGRAR